MSHTTEPTTDSAESLDRNSALFAQLVLQQTNMAMMLLGKVTHPETGQVYKDVDAARLFIDQLEMLEAKTRGNLSRDESGLLKQSLMNLRMAFVEVVETGKPQAAAPGGSPTETGRQPQTQSATPPETASPADDEHRKKFSKKY